MYPHLAPWHNHRGSDGKLYYLDTTKRHSMHREKGLIVTVSIYFVVRHTGEVKTNVTITDRSSGYPRLDT